MSQPLLEIRGLVKSYPGVKALQGVDLDVAPGEVFGLLGPNGAGKSTTVKAVVTLLKPDAGQVRIAGIDALARPDAVRALLGYVPQELSSDKSLTARENLRLFGRLYHLDRAARVRRSAELLALLGLEEAADRRVRSYSGGMRKRLDLACGLLHAPRLLVLDEPTLGLDPVVRRAIWDHVLALAASGMTVLLATNSMEEAEALCGRLAIIDRGRITRAGDPEGLKRALGGDVVSLSFDPAHPMPRALPGKLSSVAGVKRLVVHPDRIDVTVGANDTAFAPLVEAARAAGAVVARASYSRPSLEEVFLDATGHRFSEPAPAEPAEAAP